MSLKVLFPAEIPPETRRVVEPLLSADSVYRLLGEALDQIVRDADFAAMYATDGRPAVPPVILALVTAFQFLEKLPDRAAAQMAVLRLDWKYALRQPLDWSGFHYSDLCNFRARLLEHGQEQVVFERLLSYLRAHGYLKIGGKQRTDATHVLGAVKRLSRLEQIWESLRLAFNALMSADAPWVLKWLPASFVRTHSQRRSQYRLDKTEVEHELLEAGKEGAWLLGQLEAHGTQTLQGLPEIAQLRRVLDEQFEPATDETLLVRSPREIPSDSLSTPHDPDVRYGHKGDLGWVGYKLQVTETADEDMSARFITDVAITPAIVVDNQYLPGLQERLSAHGVAPGKHYVDQGYMSADNLVTSRERGIDLRGYIKADTSGKPPGFQLQNFDIDIEQQQATCPAGRTQARWHVSKPNPQNLVAHHVFFGAQCQECVFFGPGLCTDKSGGRHLSLNQHHAVIQENRREAATEAFKQEMHTRGGIEGAISEIVRAHGARHSRYRGMAKNRLQALFTATATNLKRMARSVALLSGEVISALFNLQRHLTPMSA